MPIGRGSANHRYKDGRSPTGYRIVGVFGEGKATHRLEHRIIAERALGRPLDPKHPVHHHGGDIAENTGLVICEDQAYHMLLHLRERALAECGNPSWRKCTRCKQYDAPEMLLTYPYGVAARHRARHGQCVLGTPTATHYQPRRFRHARPVV